MEAPVFEQRHATPIFRVEMTKVLANMWLVIDQSAVMSRNL